MVCTETLRRTLDLIYNDPHKIDAICSYYDESSADSTTPNHEKISSIHNSIAGNILAKMKPNPNANVDLEYTRISGVAFVTPIIFWFLEEPYDIRTYKDVMDSLSLEFQLRQVVFFYNYKCIDQHIDRLKNWRNHGISKPKIRQKKMKFKQQIDYYEIQSVSVIVTSLYEGVDVCSGFEEYFDMIFENEGLCHHELLPYRYVNLDIWCSICEKCIDVGFGL